MLRWASEGVLLSVRRHGESSAIIEVFTPDRGRHAGVVRGGASRKMAPVLQPGNQLALEWSARLEDHIGSFRAELAKSRAGLMMDAAALSTLQYICALTRAALPERDSHSQLYDLTVHLLETMPQDGWQLVLVGWELQVLSDLGVRLDLSRCAVTGATQGLAYVSPKSGQAVTVEGAGEWADRLLPLPAFLSGQAPAEGDAAAGLKLTGHFLEKRFFTPQEADALRRLREQAVSAILG